ncbi:MULTISPECIES: MFS transporter [unclassified Brevibacterium]|uniref:MFS transporter n=1 Tax=unclassified Brevibacterium TaxID=2614124 RepID=UPI0010919B2F|nr:MFS transporter [Brevibacterium sp. S22]TGD31141.1 MFS transporter [Brevibacterium sp. S22]
MILAIVLLGYFMILLDTSIVVTGLPVMGEELGLTALHLSWVQNSYTLVFGGLLLLAARTGDLFGRRRMLLTGLTLFSVSSLLIGLAPSAGWLIGGRLLQGAGAAILAPTTLALITEHFPEGPARIRATSAYGAVAGIGAAAGMVLGGVFADLLSWRVGFLVNVPVGVHLAILALRALPGRDAAQPGHLDLPGAITSTLGVAFVLFGIVEASELGWGNPVVDGSLAAGVVLFAIFLLLERRAVQPLLPLSLFSSVQRNGALATRFLLVASVMSFFFFVTQLMQTGMGMSPLQAGLGFLPLSLVQFLFASVVPRLGRAGVSQRTLVVVGVLIMSGGMAWLAFATVGESYLLAVAGPMLLLGAGQGLAFGPLTGAAVSGARADEAGAASGLVNAVHQIGGTFGVGALSSLTVGVLGTGAAASAVVGRADLGFSVAAGLLLLGAVLALVCLNESRADDRPSGRRRFGRMRVGIASGERVGAEPIPEEEHDRPCRSRPW